MKQRKWITFQKPTIHAQKYHFPSNIFYTKTFLKFSFTRPTSKKRLAVTSANSVSLCVGDGQQARMRRGGACSTHILFLRASVRVPDALPSMDRDFLGLGDSLELKLSVQKSGKSSANWSNLHPESNHSWEEDTPTNYTGITSAFPHSQCSGDSDRPTVGWRC